MDIFYYIRHIQPDFAFAQVVSWWCGIQHQQHQVKGPQACQAPFKRKEETTQMKQMKDFIYKKQIIPFFNLIHSQIFFNSYI